MPTIIESQKTIDRKTFYKTADISQIVICREGEPSDEEDAPVKAKKYDPNKVRFLSDFALNHCVIMCNKNIKL